MKLPVGAAGRRGEAWRRGAVSRPAAGEQAAGDGAVHAPGAARNGHGASAAGGGRRCAAGDEGAVRFELDLELNFRSIFRLKLDLL